MGSLRLLEQGRAGTLRVQICEGALRHRRAGTKALAVSAQAEAKILILSGSYGCGDCHPTQSL